MRSAVAVVILVLLLTIAHPLEQWLRAEAPPRPEANRIGVGRVMGGVLTGGFRPLLQTYLFLRMDVLYGQGRSDEQLVLCRTMVSLYPNNRKAQEYLAWLMAFNLKQEAETDALAWRWARAGIEILARIPGARRTLADWFLKQPGQNPVYLLRYAGEDWRRERWWRERLRRWSEARYGEPLTRFELGLRALGESDLFLDRLRRLALLRFKVIDDFVREGRSASVDEAIALCEWMAAQENLEELPAPPGWGDLYRREAFVLRSLEERTVSVELLQLARYDVAAALWGIGAHARDPKLLAAAELELIAFQTSEGVECPDELDGIRRWIRHLGGSGEMERPPLPFD